MTEELSNLDLWNLVAGFLLPPVLAVIQQPRWPDWLRAGVAFVAALLVAVGTTYFEGGISGEDWVRSALVVFVVAVATYASFWKKTGLAPRIEEATAILR